MATSVEQVARHLERQARIRSARAEARAAALRECLPDATRLLVKRGARRIFLFGSLSTNRVTEQSDVDLAVEGLASAGYFAALADLMAVFGGPVDLVLLEEAPETLKQRILAEGVEL